MRHPRSAAPFAGAPVHLLLLVALLASSAAADWVPFDALPRADRVRAAQGAMNRFPRDGQVERVDFDLDAREVRYRVGGAWFAIAYDGGEARSIEEPRTTADAPRRTGRRGGAGGVARGRQATTALSPDEAWTATHRAGNLHLKPADGEEFAITEGGDERLKYGSASWVYGEELDQNTAMWWSPDSTKLAFYRFDDRPVKPFELMTKLTQVRPAVETEAYPKAGEPNPIAALMVYDLASKATVDVDVGPETDQYVYAIEWTPKGEGLLFRRTNRRQDTLDIVLADPTTGASRVVLTETQSTWQKNNPTLRFLADGRRFLWESERSGFAQYELRSLDGGEPIAITGGDFPVESIVRVDEERGELWYMARSSETRINPQLHRAALDGSGSTRVTPDDLHWSNPRIASDGAVVVATSEFVDRPAETWLLDRDGRRIAKLAGSESDPWAALGLPKPEFVRLVAADGETPIYGILHRPSDFDPSRRYPLVVEAYGGPGFALVSSRTNAGKAQAEFGALLLTIDNRGTPGRGKAFESANYLSLGGADADDQAAAVRQLVERGLVDPERVAIVGHSYGGFISLMGILRHPEVFGVAVSGAPVTDWRHYDTIYTERYMRTPQENPEGYDGFSATKLASNLKGKLLLLHGMADDNVHPNNAWELVHALQTRNIPFSMMFFPEARHGIFSPAVEGVRWTFLLRHLGLMDSGSSAP